MTPDQLSSFFDGLDGLARVGLAPLERLLSAQEDLRVVAERGDGFVLMLCTSQSGSRCPFEVHVGVDDCHGRFNFYVGKDGEFYNFELLVTEADVAMLRDDLEGFMRSPIDEVVWTRDGKEVGRGYSIRNMKLDGVPIRFGAGPLCRWPWRRYAIQRNSYVPWEA